MNIKSLSLDIKSAIESVDGCQTTTTPKKGLGFVPKNKWNIKWGQVDVRDNMIRIVLDNIPGKYSEESIKEITDIPEKIKGSKVTGFFVKKTDNPVPDYDAIEISIYSDELNTISSEKLLGFILKCAEESSFKSKASSTEKIVKIAKTF